MKKIIFPLITVPLLAITLEYLYIPFTTFTEYRPCLEGCSSIFKNITISIYLTAFVAMGVISYFYAVKKINKCYFLGFIIFMIILRIFLLWYASIYGYGLNLSY